MTDKRVAALEPLTVALIGFGEAGSTIGRGLCAADGWRGAARPGDNRPRRVIAIDTALDRDERGRALGTEARRLEIAISRDYTSALSEADLVICAVQGEHALAAARAAAPLLKPGALFLDLCTVTGVMAEEDRLAIGTGAGVHVDVAVMGGFFSQGLKAPLLVAGPRVEAVVAWLNAGGFNATALGERPGSASAVKMVRSVLLKGMEALGVEALVTARRQGILEEVLACLADIDRVPFRDHLSMLVRTHLVHAERRREEMELVARTLLDSGVEPLMTEVIERSHRRTVEAGVAPPDGQVPDLDTALAILSERVVGGPARTPR